jgi:DNA polymerase III sliding clamp (beta) subunit (PCNA family)
MPRAPQYPHKGITVAPATAGSRGPLVAAAVTGEGFPCAFNPYFLADALDTFDTETVTVHFTKAARPAVLTGATGDLDDHTTFKHLLMPIRMAG